MTPSLRPTRAVIDLDALASNYRALARSLPAGSAVMPVVKADGYGHGAAHVARRLAREGAPIFAVAVVEEGLELRRAGITQPILVMGWIGNDQLGALVEGGLTPNVHSLEQAEELKIFLEGEEGKAAPLPVHLKLDTGMTRLGVLPAEVPRVLDLLGGLKKRIF
ncbi:MAG TPA: alanine racemase, partial [Thermoanaerobaculia bacterium]|nr:alanine racemase [Thermoanaerobaculia bacterium]